MVPLQLPFPRWGGVVINNPPIEVCESTEPGEAAKVQPDESAIIGVVLTQLRLLLGIPELVRFVVIAQKIAANARRHKSSVCRFQNPIPGVSALPLNDLRPRDWELDAAMRVRAIEQLTSAKLTLQSLAQLLEEISNIVITDTVGSRIKDTLSFIQESTAHLEKGELEKGFFSSKRAFVNAEAAFTDPSLLALLYFPDDQKWVFLAGWKLMGIEKFIHFSNKLPLISVELAFFRKKFTPELAKILLCSTGQYNQELKCIFEFDLFSLKD